MNSYPWRYKVEGCVCVGGGKRKQKNLSEKKLSYNAVFFQMNPLFSIWPQLTVVDYMVFNLLPLLQVLRFG